MTLSQIIDKIRRLTNTNSTDYTDAEAVFDVNAAQEWAISKARKYGGDFVADSRYEDQATATFPLDGSSVYTVTEDEDGNPVTSIVSLSIDGAAVPRVNPGDGPFNGASPRGYYLQGNSIIPVNFPESGTATLTFTRGAFQLTTSDMAVEPGLPRELQPILYKLPANEYKYSKGDISATDLENAKALYERDIAIYYGTVAGAARVTAHTTNAK